MSPLLSRRLALLGERANLPLLSQCLHGIERECLRVDGNGKLALTPHPQALGSALTHPHYHHRLFRVAAGIHHRGAPRPGADAG